MFLAMFSLLFVFESMLNWQKLGSADQQKPKSRFRLLLALAFALLPIAYIIGINFMNLNQTVMSVGEILRGDYWKAQSTYWYLILGGDWPLTLEYIVFTISFVSSVFLAFGKSGLRSFSISLGLVAGIAVFYFIDMWFPYGAFWPFQLLTRPTAFFAGAILKSLGFQFTLTFPPAIDSSPILTTQVGLPLSVTVEWVCAGVHSLLLYSLLILLFFKKSSISMTRKVAYFIAGAIGTYITNVLRVVTYFAIMVNQGLIAASEFHDTYGELFFAAWLFVYVFVVMMLQRFHLVEKFRSSLHCLINRWRT